MRYWFVLGGCGVRSGGDWIYEVGEVAKRGGENGDGHGQYLW